MNLGHAERAIMLATVMVWLVAIAVALAVIVLLTPTPDPCPLLENAVAP